MGLTLREKEMWNAVWELSKIPSRWDLNACFHTRFYLKCRPDGTLMTDNILSCNYIQQHTYKHYGTITVAIR